MQLQAFSFRVFIQKSTAFIKRPAMPAGDPGPEWYYSLHQSTPSSRRVVGGDAPNGLGIVFWRFSFDFDWEYQPWSQRSTANVVSLFNTSECIPFGFLSLFVGQGILKYYSAAECDTASLLSFSNVHHESGQEFGARERKRGGGEKRLSTLDYTALALMNEPQPVSSKFQLRMLCRSTDLTCSNN